MSYFHFSPINLIIAAAVSAVVEIIASAAIHAVASVGTAFAALIAEVIGQRQADRTAVPSILAELPEAFPPCDVPPCAAVEQVTHVKRQRQLFVQESVSQTEVDRITMARRSLGYYTRRTVVSGDLAAEILGEHKLGVDPYGACKDILSRQINRNWIALVHDRVVYGGDVVPIEIGARCQL